jgi:hypothetical protein
MVTKIVTAAVLSLTLAGAAVAEDSQWQKDHPRREQVNNRLANQNARIDKQVANGQMSKAEAAKLHSNDHAIRQEERDMAKQNGGHITKQEQKTLNQQENANSKQIAEH